MLSRIRIPHRRLIPQSLIAKPIWSALIFGIFGAFTPSLFGQIDSETRPATQDLLPETTVAFVQIDDFRDLMTKMAESSIGQMTQDEAVSPLLEGLWGEAKTAYEDVKDQVGVSLEDFQELPSGEMTFAMIAPRQAEEPAFILIVELDGESEALDRVLDRGRQLITEEASQEITTEESDDGIEFESFRVEEQSIKFFRKDGLIVGSNSETELDAFIDRWMEREVEGVRPLSKNRKFITIMNRCAGTKDLKPEARFFADPMKIYQLNRPRSITNPFVDLVLDAVGLGGFNGIGGSMILTEDDFESVVQAHVLLSPPRKGIFEMIALKPTDYKPEPWLPADTATYMTTSWDVEQMLAELTKMLELIYPYPEEEADEDLVDDKKRNWVDDFFENQINANINDPDAEDPTDPFDVRADVLEHLTGRVTYAEWISSPISLGSQVQIFALELADAEAFQTSFERIIQKVNSEVDEDEGDRIVAGEYEGAKTWMVSMERQRERQMERRRQRREEQGQDTDGLELEAEMMPQPAFAIVGDYLLMSFSSRSMQFIEHAIDTQEKEDSEALVDDELFHSVTQKMSRLLQSDMPCMMTYQNPEHAFRFLFELTKSAETRDFISRRAENNKYLDGIKRQFDENPLPDFDEMKKYFRPSGGFAVSDETGYHFLGFSLRADE